MRVGLLIVVTLVSGCPQLADRTQEPIDSPASRLPSHLVATERGARGGHLVFIGQDGARLTDLTNTGAVAIRDQGAAWSPDGKWIAFESSRGRDTLHQTSLWIIAAKPGAKPRRVTLGPTIDRHPVWVTPSALVFVSQERGKSSNLSRLDLSFGPHGPRAIAPPKQLTDSSSHDESPTVSPDGNTIAFMRVRADRKRSTLWKMALRDGSISQLTKGPSDITPAWSTNPEHIAFAAPVPKRGDYDIYLLDIKTGTRQRLIDESFADQTGPRWSRDGRFLFCTSLYRAAASREPVLSSVTFVDLHARPKVLRALHDPAAVESRFGPTMAPQFNDGPALHNNDDYRVALRKVISEQLRRKQDIETVD